MRGRLAPAAPRPALALAVLAIVAAGCLGRTQGFEAKSRAWTADLDDRTGTVAAIRTVDVAAPNPGAPSDGVALRNVAPDVIEVSWVGAACPTRVRFSLALADGPGMNLRYDLGLPCADPASAVDPARPRDSGAAGAASVLDIRFNRPTDAGSITTLPSWGP